MAAQPIPGLTVEEYFALEESSSERHEYYRGQAWAMSGGTLPHSLLNSNLGGLLWITVRKKKCTLHTGHLRLGVEVEKAYFYPDLMVVCGEHKFSERFSETILNPVLVIEVLSKSTENFDRGEKFATYRKIASLREYVLVSQAEARLEHFARQDDGSWIFREYSGMDAVMPLASIESTLALADIYEKVEFAGE